MKEKTMTNELPDREWVSAKEACEYLGISFPTLKRYIKLGKLTSSQIVPRGNIRIHRDSIKELLNPRID